MKLLHMTLALVMTAALCAGCSNKKDSQKAEPKKEEVPLASTNTLGDVSLHEKYSEHFSVGTAISPYHVTNSVELLTRHFNRITVENDMKMGYISLLAGKYNWETADTMVNFARKHKMKLTGHALLWHKSVPDWLFADLEAENKEDIETLKKRLRTHIFAMVKRYGDVVDNWDVVNEAVSDSGPHTYRNIDEGSNWHHIFGNEEYIYWAFVYADEANKKYGRTAKLYYNDYSMTDPAKRERTITMLRWLQEKGAPIDGVGMQAHWKVKMPDMTEIERSIEAFSSLGLEVKISELDVSIYNKDDWNNYVYEDQKVYSKSVSDEQAAYYKKIFTVFRKHSDKITSVTFWSPSDETSWLNYYPIMRKDYPMLFDRKQYAKKAYFEVIDF